MEQLEENLAPFVDGNAPELTEDVLAAINKVHIKCQEDPRGSLKEKESSIRPDFPPFVLCVRTFSAIPITECQVCTTKPAIPKGRSSNDHSQHVASPRCELKLGTSRYRKK
jgi:hypothetical protein